MVGVCDQEKLMADQLAERFEVARSFSDVDQLLTETRPDVVHITTPPQSHFQLTKKCLEAGCHVYVEKPFSLDLSEAREMFALAEKFGLRIIAGHNYQFSPDMNKMRELVRSGALGAPIHIESTFSYDLGDATYVGSLFGDRSHWVRSLPGKLLQNVISHGIAKIAEFLVEEEFNVVVHGFTSPKLQRAGVTDITDELRVLISTTTNLTAYFTFTTQVVPPVQELRVFGTKGSVVADSLHRTIVRLDNANSSLKSYLNFVIPASDRAKQYLKNTYLNIAAFLKADFHMDVGMKILFEAFYRSIRFGDPSPVSPREILLTAAIMDEIFRQLANPTQAFDSPRNRAAMVR